VAAITETYGIDDSDVLVFLSGSKGFHVGVSTAFWSPAPDLAFHRIARRFAEAIAEQAGAGIDTGVYDRVRCFRAPNSRHPKTGLHKRRLTVEELMHLRLDAIQDAAKQPAPFDLPTPNATSNAAAELWSQSVTAVRAETEAKAERNAKGTADQLNRTTLEFIRDGAPEGDRHRLLYSASANLAELGAPLGLCVALLTESALDCGLPPGDVRRAIENGHHGAQSAPTTVGGPS
jgi:hypothetical protein